MNVCEKPFQFLTYKPSYSHWQISVFVISAHFSNICVVLEKGLPLFSLGFYKANFACSDRDTWCTLQKNLVRCVSRKKVFLDLLYPTPTKSISLEQICKSVKSWTNLLNKSVISRYCPNFTALSSFFNVKKQRPKTNLEKFFSLVTY